MGGAGAWREGPIWPAWEHGIWNGASGPLRGRRMTGGATSPLTLAKADGRRW